MSMSELVQMVHFELQQLVSKMEADGIAPAELAIIKANLQNGKFDEAFIQALKKRVREGRHASEDSRPQNVSAQGHPSPAPIPHGGKGGKGRGKGGKGHSGQAATPRGWHRRSGKTVTMYHGTTKENARQILNDGAFKQSDTGMLGRGVYLSDDIAKAQRYGDGAIFTVEVKVGRVKRIDSQSHPLRTSWNSDGYNSAWVPRDCGMVASGLSETCVFNPARIRITSISMQ